MKTIRRIFLVCGCLLAIVSNLAQAPEAGLTQARELLTKGIAAFRNNDPQLAIDSFNRALELNPELTDARLYLGMTYASMATDEGTKKAVESFERVLARQPGHTEALSRLAGIYQASREYARARTLYLRLTQSSPQDAAAFYSVGAMDWLIAANKQNPLPEGDRRALIEEGLQSLDVALRLNPQYVEAMTYYNVLLRQKAEITTDPAERANLIAQADAMFSRALQARQNQQSAPAPGANLQGGPRVGSTLDSSSLIRRVEPIYPQRAREAGVQGLVLLKVTIDKSGLVTDISVISGHPFLNDAAIEAVKQWAYRPVLLNGQAIDVITTVTVNFSNR